MNQTALEPSTKEAAFEYLRTLPPYQHEGDRTQVIGSNTASGYTGTFRTTTDNFTIPISWNIEKGALINLLGITSYNGYNAINGIRLYAGINDDNQLTLIAVTTTDCNSGTDDLTVDDNYPYYDYANPCPNNCSSTGNLKVSGVNMTDFTFSRVS